LQVLEEKHSKSIKFKAKKKSLQEAKVGRMILGKIRNQFNFGLVYCRKEKSAKSFIFRKISK
jgi:hypothetical protein